MIPVFGQVASNLVGDGSLGTSVNQTGNLLEINGGTSAGGVNLFHSFSHFDVGTGDVARFNGAGGIQNIISRVTGGSASLVDGTIESSIAGANLYLINPYGLTFGPNAIINIDGSFHASTADYLRFANGEVFFANPASSSTLSVAPVARFGFMQDTPAGIEVYTPTVQDTGNPRVGTPGLMTPQGASISIVGGNITLGAPDGSAPAYLYAPNGSIRVASVASRGEAIIGSGADIDVSRFDALGAIRMQGNSLLDGHHVVVRGGQIEIADATALPGAFSVFGLGTPPDGGQVDIAATRSLAISGSTVDPVFGAPFGVLAFAGLDPSVPLAKVPDVRLSAQTISMTGFSGVTTNRFLGGPSGTVTLEADTVRLDAGASVSILNAFAGDGGLLRVNAREVLLDGTGATGFTGFAAQGVFNPAYLVTSIDPALTFAASGSIEVVATAQLRMQNGAEITTDSKSFGPSGNITLRARNATLDDARILAQSSLAGDSGDVLLNIDQRLTLTNGSVISAATLGGGTGGAVRITAGEAVVIDGEASGIASQTTPLPGADQDAFAALVLGGGTFADLVAAFGLPADADMFDVLTAMNAFGLSTVPADQLTPGAGGAIELITPNLSISGLNAAIDSSTAWDGDAGNVNIQADTITVGPGATLGSRTGIPDLATGELFVGTGRAGNVSVNASGQISVAGNGATISTDSRGVGNAGNVEVSAYRLLVTDGARISSSSTGTGLAGDIRITLGDSLQLNAGSIATEAITSDGGNISITAPRLVELINGRITTSVGSGQGNGGNIFIDPDFVVLQSSRIVANAFGGAGGNIDIIAGFLIVSPDSLIDASSALGVDGFVRTTAPDSDVSAALAVLPSSYLDAASRLQAGCGAARTGQSSLAQVGRGGLPAPPGDYLVSSFESVSTTGHVAANDPGPNASRTDATFCSL